MGFGLAAAALFALAPAARADDKSGSAHASPSDQPKTNDARTTAPDSATTGNTDRAGTTASGTTPSGTSPSGTTASTTGATTRDSKKQPSRHDNSDIITKLYQDNVMEIEAAKIAKDNTKNDAVKDFADRMEKDHGDMNDQLKKLADNRNLKLDDDAAKRQHKAHLEQMKNMKDAQLDRHYTQMMKQDHQRSLREVESALKRVEQSGDHELAQVLESARTTIQRHNGMATALDTSRGASDQRMGRRPGEPASTSTSPSSTSGTQRETGQGAAGSHGGATDQGHTGTPGTSGTK